MTTPPLPRAPTLQRLATTLRRHTLALLLYVVLAVGFTYPAILHMGTAITGEHRGDTLQNYWNLWWTAEALLHLHQNPFEASYLHYPFGLGLYFHTYNGMNGLLSLPLQACCGTAAAFNALNMFALVMSGVGMYALVLFIISPLPERRFIAFIAGGIYAFSPYMAFHLKVGQPFMLSLEWFPLYLLMLLKALRAPVAPRRTWPALLAAALLLIIIGLTDWHYTMYALLLTALVGGFEAVRQRQRAARLRLGQSLALLGVLFALGMAPVLVPMLHDLAEGNNAVRDLRHSIYHSTDVLAFFFPSIYHPLWGEWASAVFHERLVERFITGGVASLGYVPLLLALCGAVGERQRSRLFVLVFVVFFLLALGPYLRINGYNTYESRLPIPLPYLLFRQLPFMDIHRIPSRFVSLVMLALAVLAALGMQWLLQRPALAQRPRWQRGSLLALLALLVLFEFWPRQFGMTPTTADQVSPFYRQLASERASAALLEIPGLDYRSMFYQTHHGMPIMGGNISRPQGHEWRRARLLGAPIQVVPPWDDVGVDESAAATRSALRCQGVRYVVVYTQETGEATRSRIRRVEQHLFADIAPVYEDETLRAYEVFNEQPQHPYWTPDPDEWYAPEPVAPGGGIGRWSVGEGGSLLIYPCGAQQQQARVQFDVFGFGQHRTVALHHNGASLGSFGVPPGSVRRIALVVPLQPGENRLTLHSAEPATSPAGSTTPGDARLVSLNLSHVSVIADTRE